MNVQTNDRQYDLVVIGAGMAGMSAALFAANRNLSVFQCGKVGGLGFASGLMDLMGVFPTHKNKQWSNPWKAIECLQQSDTRHPYSKLTKQNLLDAFAELIAFFDEAGFSYHYTTDSNSYLPTAQGTIKPSYFVPESMWKGVSALETKKPCLMIDFRGLKEYSACQVVENFANSWPQLRYQQLEFPGMKRLGEVHPEHIARSLENDVNLTALINLLKTQLKNEKYLGLPAILGINKTKSILRVLEQELGVSVFEIPTPAVSVSGLRIKELFARELPKKGIVQLHNSKVTSSKRLEDGSFRLTVSHQNKTQTVSARSAILATGRFFGGGLQADRATIREPIFNLPVFQPSSRQQWHNIEFFSSKGHPVNRAGVEVDDSFRPLNDQQQPVFNNLFAAGSILAHQDWIREKSGSGIAVASAYKAVDSLKRFLPA